MIGYKGFDKNLICRGIKFEVGKTYEEDADPKTVREGYHFCIEPYGCLDYYDMKYGNRFCLVEALGKISTDNDVNTKACTNKIRIIRELSYKELTEEQLKYRGEIDKKIMEGIYEFQRRNKELRK